MAETHVGVRVFDMNYILGAKKLPPTADLNAPFVLPQVGFYKQAKGAGLTFSFVETDRTSPALITGKYQDKKYNRRIVRWPLDAGSGLPALQANGAWKMPATNVQGGLMHNGRLLAASSYNPKGSGGIGELVAGNPDQPAAALRAGRTAPRTCTTPGPATACTRSPRRPATASCSRSTAPRSASRRSIDDVTAIAILLGLAIGIVVGSVGGGGAILALPVLIYVLDEPVGPASTASLVVVSLAAAIGAGSLARHGRVCWRLAFRSRLPAALGSLLGTLGQPQRRRRARSCSAFVPVMLLAAVATWRRTGDDADGGCPHPPLARVVSPGWAWAR